jgi:hypothetical protein
VDAVSSILAAFGLSASAGLNAYIPLLIVSLMARFTHWVELAPPWDNLSSWWVIGALVVLSLIEFFADKVPAVNHVNDVVQTFVRPAAGAVLFAASTGTATHLHPVVAIIAGLVVAGTVHAAKALAVRPAVTATTAGAGNVPVSIVEDLVATVLSILAVVIPILIAVILVVVAAYVIWLLWRRANAVRTA